MGIFENTTEQALPQTIIHKLITEHFSSPLPEGKTVKKAIFLGYDGFRADGLENIRNMETSGSWADFNGIDDNSQMKNADAKTFLTEIAETGKSASFTTSWREHTKLSYRPDIVYAIENGLPVEYTHQVDDAATYYQILKYTAKPEGVQKTAAEDPDVIFFTFEHTDHAGHDTGFGNQNEEYIAACKEADSWGYEILKTIEARSTYAEEDWLIIISTDHGGTETSHGGQTPFERMTWLACNHKIEMTAENLQYARKK